MRPSAQERSPFECSSADPGPVVVESASDPMDAADPHADRPPVVFVKEAEDSRTGRLLGRFNARFERAWRKTTDAAEDLTVDDAIVWGRARAGLVLVRFGRRVELWSAGATPHWSYPPWPPPDVPPLRPRPVPPEDWQAVGGGGSELWWAVTIRLTPEDVLAGASGDDPRDRWDVAVATAAAARGLGWDRTQLDRFLADAGPALASAPPQGFATAWSPAYRVYAMESALDAAAAERAVARAFRPPEGFRVVYTARPADISEYVRK